MAMAFAGAGVPEFGNWDSSSIDGAQASYSTVFAQLSAKRDQQRKRGEKASDSSLLRYASSDLADLASAPKGKQSHGGRDILASMLDRADLESVGTPVMHHSDWGSTLGAESPRSPVWASAEDFIAEGLPAKRRMCNDNDDWEGFFLTGAAPSPVTVLATLPQHALQESDAVMHAFSTAENINAASDVDSNHMPGASMTNTHKGEACPKASGRKGMICALTATKSALGKARAFALEGLSFSTMALGSSMGLMHFNVPILNF